jgi:hypothetical protein
VSLTLDQNLITFPDSRPGKLSRFHKQIRSSVDVKLSLPGQDGSVEVTGNLLFFLTRGDSAAIPPELVSRGVGPDSTRWWLDGMEDETLGGVGVLYMPRPSKRITLRGLLEYFHSLVAH